MGKELIQYSDKGAHFHRCDFQVHSPRDSNWGNRTKPKPVSESERTEYAKSLIAACREKGVHAIAITDHHDMAFIPYIKKAAKIEFKTKTKNNFKQEPIVVFPGVELTLNLSYQALILFDPNFEESNYSRFLEILNTNISPSCRESTSKTDTLQYSLLELMKRLDERDWLRNKYIIFPNVSDCAKHSILRKGLKSIYRDTPFIGGYIDGSECKLKARSLNILNGEVEDWGYKSVAYIQTSDDRSRNHENLGNASSWIKWTVPTAEALRQACLAKKSRIFNTKPVTPSIFIKSITVKNSTFLGSLSLSLNSQYNTLIGGRGTGKSTIFECIRWTLCDQPPEIMSTIDSSHQSRRIQMIETTLDSNSSEVEIAIAKDGKLYHVRRCKKNKSVQIKQDGGEFRSCTEDDIRKFIPIRAYSQKQLGEVKDREQELARFISAEVEPKLEDLDKKILNRKGTILKYILQYSRRVEADRRIKQLRDQKKICTGQVNQIRASLSDMTGADVGFVEAMPELEKIESQIDSLSFWFNTIKKGLSEQEEHAKQIEKENRDLSLTNHVVFGNAKMSNFYILKDFFNEIRDELGRISSRMSQQHPRLKFDELSEVLADIRKKYEDAVKRSNARENQKNRLRDLETMIRNVEWEIKDETFKLALNIPFTDLKDDLNELTKLRKKRQSLTKIQCEKLHVQSEKRIRASVSYEVDACTMLLKEMLKKADIEENRVEGVIDLLNQANDKFEMWADILNGIWILATEFSQEKFYGSVLGNSGFSISDCVKLEDKFTQNDWERLISKEFLMKIKFEYKVGEEFIEFSKASLGQQSTSLLIALLNKDSEMPLLIDQPEEDLDNSAIQLVANGVLGAKKSRQIIFVSHNASLVVNGDAELVICCNGPGKPIEDEGSIDVNRICRRIIDLTDGGKDAFNLRRKKYGF